MRQSDREAHGHAVSGNMGAAGGASKLVSRGSILAVLSDGNVDPVSTSSTLLQKKSQIQNFRMQTKLVNTVLTKQNMHNEFHVM